MQRPVRELLRLSTLLPQTSADTRRPLPPPEAKGLASAAPATGRHPAEPPPHPDLTIRTGAA